VQNERQRANILKAKVATVSKYFFNFDNAGDRAGGLSAAYDSPNNANRGVFMDEYGQVTGGLVLPTDLSKGGRSKMGLHSPETPLMLQKTKILNPTVTNTRGLQEKYGRH
jgi:hypothetical protein